MYVRPGAVVDVSLQMSRRTKLSSHVTSKVSQNKKQSEHAQTSGARAPNQRSLISFGSRACAQSPAGRARMRAWERRTPRLALVAASVLVVAHPAAAQQGFAEGQILLIGRRAVLRMGGRQHGANVCSHSCWMRGYSSCAPGGCHCQTNCNDPDNAPRIRCSKCC